MLADIKAGKIKRVVVKDMSRLGRNYLQVGMYTEMVFPEYGVHFIAVNDGVDSIKGDSEFTAIRNVFNEYYARDISKKRRIVNKMKGNSGVPLSPPPYGYIKNPEDPRFWVIDPEAAEVVRRIYQMALDGYGLAETAAALEQDDLLAAQAVRKAKKQHPDILLFYLRPYHPAERSFTPAGFDGSFYPPGMETVPRKLAIVRANRYMVDNSQFLIAYARYTVSNAWELTEYAWKREKKGLIHVENLAQV